MHPSSAISWLRNRLIWQDIRFWTALSILVHLIGIDSPPIEVGHSWRQCLTAMVARNFTEIDPDIRFPRVDMGGAGTGIIGSEFPLLNYLMAWLDQLLGPAYWHGRGIVLVTASIAVYFFYRLVKGLFGREVAFSSSLVLLASSWFEYSRKIMPDVFSISLVLIALFCAWRYVTTGRIAPLVCYVLFAAAGVLGKMPAASLLGILVVPVLDPGLPRLRRGLLALASLFPLAALLSWYFVWVPHLLDTYGYQLYYPRSLATGAMELWHAKGLVLEKFGFQALCSYVGAGTFLVGLVLIAAKRSWRILLGGVAFSMVFFFYMLKTGDVFAQHSYYVLPAVPLIAVLAGMAAARVPVKFRWLVLLVIGVEGVANQAYDLATPDRNRYLLELETLADRFSPPGQLVVVNGGLDPKYMYFLHRRGWSVAEAECRDAKRMNDLVQQGAACLFLINANPPTDLPWPVVFKDDHVAVIDLSL